MVTIITASLRTTSQIRAAASPVGFVDDWR